MCRAVSAQCPNGRRCKGANARHNSKTRERHARLAAQKLQAAKSATVAGETIDENLSSLTTEKAAEATTAKIATPVSAELPSLDSAAGDLQKAMNSAKEAEAPAKEAEAPAKEAEAPAKEAVAPAKKAEAPAKEAVAPAKKAKRTPRPVLAVSSVEIIEGPEGEVGLLHRTAEYPNRKAARAAAEAAHRQLEVDRAALAARIAAKTAPVVEVKENALDANQVIAGSPAAVREALRKPGGVSPEGMMAAVKQRVHSIRAATAISPNMTAEVGKKLAVSQDTELRVALATNRHAPAETLELLSKDKFFKVRREVASNPATPAPVLQKLTEDPDASVRRDALFATGKNPTEEQLQAPVPAKAPEQGFDVSGLPGKIPTAAPYDRKTMTVAESGRSTLSTGEGAAWKKLSAMNITTTSQIKNLETSDALRMVHFTRDHNHLKALASINLPKVKEQVAKRHDIDSATVAELMKSKAERVRVALSTNPRLSDEDLFALSKDDNATVRAGVFAQAKARSNRDLAASVMEKEATAAR